MELSFKVKDNGFWGKPFLKRGCVHEGFKRGTGLPAGFYIRDVYLRVKRAINSGRTLLGEAFSKIITRSHHNKYLSGFWVGRDKASVMGVVIFRVYFRKL